MQLLKKRLLEATFSAIHIESGAGKGVLKIRPRPLFCSLFAPNTTLAIAVSVPRHRSHQRPATAAAVNLAFPTLSRSDFRSGASSSLGGGEETRFINLDAMKHRAGAGYVGSSCLATHHVPLILEEKKKNDPLSMKHRAINSAGYVSSSCSATHHVKRKSIPCPLTQRKGVSD